MGKSFEDALEANFNWWYDEDQIWDTTNHPVGLAGCYEMYDIVNNFCAGERDYELLCSINRHVITYNGQGALFEDGNETYYQRFYLDFLASENVALKVVNDVKNCAVFMSSLHTGNIVNGNELSYSMKENYVSKIPLTTYSERKGECKLSSPTNFWFNGRHLSGNFPEIDCVGVYEVTCVSPLYGPSPVCTGLPHAQNMSAEEYNATLLTEILETVSK